MNNECFTTPEEVEVPALKSVAFDVTYEPCDADNISATLTATSEIAGEFVYDNLQLRLILIAILQIFESVCDRQTACLGSQKVPSQ